MADDQKGVILSASEAGVTGEHGAAEPFSFLVGPTTTDQFNTARLRLIPIACFRVDDIRFAFDSSFVLAIAPSDPNDPTDNLAELRDLARLVKDHPGSPLSVFGHADPIGSDDYNKLLSGRRAMVIYALLIANGEPDSAIKLWQQVSATEAWGVDQRQTMQSFTGLPSGTADNTLFRTYMQKLCPPDLILTKKDFLGQGADAGGKGDFQGCGEFNPLLIFSQEKQNEFDQAKQQNDKDAISERNAENAPNRRVMVLMFRKGSRVDPAKWPCPRATEGVAGCKKRFFSDGENRRSTHLPLDDRQFKDNKDTFACRFYQRISDGSPCEDPGRSRIRILLDDPFLGFLQGVQVNVKYAGGFAETVAADSTGTIELLIDQGNFADLTLTTSIRGHSLRVFIVLASVSTPAGAWQRLVNLGYVDIPQPPPAPPDPDVLAAAVAEFQAMHGITPSGSVDASTASGISTSHDLKVAWKDEQRKDLQDSLADESASLPKDDVA